MKRLISLFFALVLVVAVMPPPLPASASRGPASYIGNWTASSTGGFGVGPANAAALPLAESGGKLYAGASNENGCQVWVKGDGDTWSRANTDGFGDTNNAGITRMEDFGGTLYAGVSSDAGCSVWRHDAGTNWTKVSTAADIEASGNIGVTSMETHGGRLYVGLSNLNFATLPPVSNGGSVYSYNGTVWTKVNDSGFGSTENMAVSELREYNGSLYAGTTKATIGYEIIGLEDIKVTLESKGCELWKYSGAGTTWSKIAGEGVTDVLNIAVSSMDVFNGELYFGTTNGDGSVTINIATQQLSDFSYDSQGLCVYSYDGSSVTTQADGGIDNPGDFSTTAMTHMDASGKQLLLVAVENATGIGKLKAYDGATWYEAADPGFGNNNNIAVASLTTFGGYFYAGTGNNQEGCEVWYGAPPVDPEEQSKTWYLAEGSTNGFETWVLVQNPGVETANVQFEYMTPNGLKEGPGVALAPQSRVTVFVADSVPNEYSVSTKVSSDVPVICERAMYWGNRVGGHDSIGVTAPSPLWYLAEGSTNGFETWVLLQNPGITPATARLTFMTPGGEVAGPEVSLAPMSRQSINVAEYVPNEYSVSTKVTANPSIIAERAMYWGNRVGGHDSIGVTSSSPLWYLAEGSTNGFETWVLLQNPGDSVATTQLTFMTPSVEVAGPEVALAPKSRQSINVADYVPNEYSVSTKVTSDESIIAERAMYWGNRVGGHDSIGVTSPSMLWYLAEGSTANGFETWVLLQNPGDTDVLANVTYMTPEGDVAGPNVQLPAKSRLSISVADMAPGVASISTRVVAIGGVIIAERAMYWGGRVGGHDSIGSNQ